MSWNKTILTIAATCVLLLAAGCPAADDDDHPADDDDSAGGDDDDDTSAACEELDCDEHAWCDDSGDVAECVCDPGYTGDGFDCEEMPSALDGLRLEMPCVPGHTGYSCAPQAMEFDDVAVLEGGMAATYTVTLQFRGVVELNSYTGGTQDGLWYTGGAVADDTYNIYSLTVSNPEATYFLNAGSAGIEHCWAIDYIHTIEAKGGAEITLYAHNQDYALIVNQDENGDPIVIPDIPPYPDAFDGQFLQMDVISVTLAGS